jgi:hypothetical protein
MLILDSTTTEDEFKSCLDPRNARLHAYQSHISLVLWPNPHLTELMLGMARSGAGWDSKEIEEAWRYAMSKPSMREVSLGISKSTIPTRLPFVALSLTTFVLDDLPTKWFAQTTMRHLRPHRCNPVDLARQTQ